MTVFDAAIDSLFADENLAVDAIYTPDGGSPVSVRAIIEHNVELASVGFSDVSDRRTIIGMRKSEIALPGRGDTILVGSTTYTVDMIVEDDSYDTQMAVR